MNKKGMRTDRERTTNRQSTPEKWTTFIFGIYCIGDNPIFCRHFGNAIFR